MKLYIATPINARQEPTMREKLVAAKHRVEMLKEILADDVRFKNYELINTFDFNDMYETEEKAMSRCIYHVLTSDAIYLDHGWTASKGCNLEYLTAKIYGKQIFEHSEQQTKETMKTEENKRMLARSHNVDDSKPHRIKFMESMNKEEKCCGNCHWFGNEDIYGVGWCIKNEHETSCDKVCNKHGF